MKRALVSVLFGCLALGLSSFASAGNNYSASIAVHIAPTGAKDLCASAPSLTAQTVVSEVDFGGDCLTGDYNLYILVCNGSSVGGFQPEGTGVAGMEFGITYDASLYLGNGARCSDLDFPSANWPDSGSGIILTWDPVGNCQSTPSEPFVPNTTIAIAYAFPVLTDSGPGQFQITPRPITGFLKVADCNSAEDDLTGLVPPHAGVGGFCTNGYSPCAGPTPVQDKTWGQIKQQFGS